jgi:hypothetical protein
MTCAQQKANSTLIRKMSFAVMLKTEEKSRHHFSYPRKTHVS